MGHGDKTEHLHPIGHPDQSGIPAGGIATAATPPHDGGPFTVHHATQLMLRLPIGALLVLVGGSISLAVALFGAGYRTATYFHDPGIVEQQLMTQKDVLQSQADKYRDLASERLHQVENLSAEQKSVADRFDQFVLDTGKNLAALKEEAAAANQRLETALREREQTLLLRDQTVTGLNQALQQRDQTVAGLNQALAARGSEVQRLTDTLKDKDAVLQQRDQTVAGLNQSLMARAQDAQKATDALKDRDASLQQRDIAISGLNQTLASRNQEAQRLAETLKDKDAVLQQRDQTLTGLNQALTARNQEVQRLTGLLRERDEEIRQRDQAIGELKKEP